MIVFWIFVFVGILIFVFFLIVDHKSERADNKALELIEKCRLALEYFSSNYANIEYYLIKDNWVSNKYKSQFIELEAYQQKKSLSDWILSDIKDLLLFYHNVENFTIEFVPHLDENHYFAYSELVPLIDLLEEVRVIKYEISNWTLKSNLNDLRKKHNKQFVERELQNNKEYFDTVLKYPLDEQQRDSIVRLEDNCLVISSAGSGKTSTSIAKVRYLLEKCNIPKEEILVLSYNRKTANEFQERLNVPGLTCKTFHALALSIISTTIGKRPDVCEPEYLLKCFYNLVKNSDIYKDALTKYFGEMASLTKFMHEYEKSAPYFKDRETYGILAPYGDMNGSPIYTKSEEEKKICSWLSAHGISFLYEQPYQYNTANTYYRQYKPDFSIYYNVHGETRRIYLEHFAIDDNGNVPIWFGESVAGGYNKANQIYKNGIVWKRQLHQEHNTVLIETYSSMFHDGSIWRELEKQLCANGVPVRELNPDERYNLLFKRNRELEDNVMNLFKSFINLMKSNEMTFKAVMKSIENSKQETEFCNRCHFLLFDVIKPLYDEYETSLKENGQLDFTDLILYATKLCEKKQYNSPYSHILVDEFQDISIDRYKFLKALRKDKPMTKLYCVGDDWQSIYRFSGSDINLINNFRSYFGETEFCKVETTYRFGNPLVKYSSRFILMNPNQQRKTVRPFSNEAKTELSFIPYIRNNETNNYLEVVFKIIEETPSNESIMLIGRYNNDVNVFPANCIETNNAQKTKVTFKGRKMIFMSVHASKGLEADHVIILNCSQDRGGFPSRVSDDPILGYVLSKIDTFEYSEERRLFYVAITRAKKHTHIIYNANAPSVFVTQMMDFINLDRDASSPGFFHCPLCKKGQLKIAKEAVSKNGNKYRNYICSNSFAGCRFKWRVFYNEELEIQEQFNSQFLKVETERKEHLQNQLKVEEKHLHLEDVMSFMDRFKINIK